MKKRFLCLFVLVVLIGFACQKYPDTSVLSTSFVVQTSRDTTASFQSYKTYYISDTIALKTTNPNDSLWFDLSAKQLVSAIKDDMATRGYTFVPKGSHPDLALGVSAIKDLNAGVIYPGWWWGYWGCYWGCYWPPYYPVSGVVYTVPTGTLIIDMLDIKNAEADHKLTVLWTAVMSGGLGNTSNDLALGIEAIHQSFDQSTYIQAN